MQINRTEYINSLIAKTGYKSDRALDTHLVLPHELNDVVVKPNDIVTAETINASYKKLYECLLYLFSHTKFANNVAPDSSWKQRGFYKTLRERMFQTTMWGGLDQDRVVEFTNVRTRYDDRLTPRGVKYMCTIIATHNELYLVPNDPDHYGDSGLYSMQNGGKLNLPDGSWSSNLIDHERPDTFTSIQSICADNDDHVFVIDKRGDTGSSLYKFDIRGLTNRDLALIRENGRIGRKLIDQIGSMTPGNLSDKVDFKNPQKVFFHDDNIYVYDTDGVDGAIKRYDTSLTWLYTYYIHNQAPIVEDSSSIVDIIPYSDGFLGVTENNTHIVYDQDFNVLSEDLIDLGVEISAVDRKYTVEIEAKKLQMSKESSDVLYTLTNVGIYKRFLSRVDTPVTKYERSMLCHLMGAGFLDTAYYSKVHGEKDPDRPRNYKTNPWTFDTFHVMLDENSGQDIISIAMTSDEGSSAGWRSNYDNDPPKDYPAGFFNNVYHPEFKTQSWNSRIVPFLDHINYISCINDGVEENMYTFEEVQIESTEYVNSFVYNKAIAKMMHCINGLRDGIMGRFERYELEEKDRDILATNVDYILNGLVYSTTHETSTDIACDLDINLNDFIGINEIVTSVVLNRGIKRLYCRLQSILDMLQLVDGSSIDERFLEDNLDLEIRSLDLIRD
jgi:hypothetical protein